MTSLPNITNSALMKNMMISMYKTQALSNAKVTSKETAAIVLTPYPASTYDIFLFWAVFLIWKMGVFRKVATLFVLPNLFGYSRVL